MAKNKVGVEKQLEENAKAPKFTGDAIEERFNKETRGKSAKFSGTGK